MMDTTKSGGAPIDLSIHDIDFIQYVFGEPKAVSSVQRKMSNDNDYLVSELVYDDFTVNITGGWFNAPISFRAEYTAIFQNGYVISSGGKIIKNGEAVTVDTGAVSENTGINISGVDGYAGEIKYFLDCVRCGKAPEIVTPESSEASVKLVERLVNAATVV